MLIKRKAADAENAGAVNVSAESSQQVYDGYEAKKNAVESAFQTVEHILLVDEIMRAGRVSLKEGGTGDVITSEQRMRDEQKRQKEMQMMQ